LPLLKFQPLYNEVTVVHTMIAYKRMEFHSFLTSAQDGAEQ